MNQDASETVRIHVADVPEADSARRDERAKLSFGETRSKLYEVSRLILEVYNAVGTDERPPCSCCDEYKQDLLLAQQRLEGTLEVNRALSIENENLRAKLQQYRRAQKVGRTGEHDDLYKRIEDIEASFRMIKVPAPPPPPPPPKTQHVARHMRSNLEQKSDAKASLRDRVKAALFEPGES